MPSNAQLLALHGLQHNLLLALSEAHLQTACEDLQNIDRRLSAFLHSISHVLHPALHTLSNSTCFSCAPASHHVILEPNVFANNTALTASLSMYDQARLPILWKTSFLSPCQAPCQAPSAVTVKLRHR